MTLRLATLVNRLARDGDARTGTPAGVVSCTRAAEAVGFDVLAVADFAVADPSVALTLAVTNSERAVVATRVLGVYTRSPVQFASLAAWLQRLSGGRFELGLGASLPHYTTGVLGIPAGREASRAEDTLRLYRALYGEEVEGVETNPDGSLRYQGRTLAVERARLDLAAHRPPVHLAAVGPRMLEVAGAWADGVILEYTTPGYLEWAWERIWAGARRTGRPLEGFEVTVETPMMTPTDDPELAVRQRSWMQSFRWHVALDVWRPLWEPAGLEGVAARARAALDAGDEERADAILSDELVPYVAPTGEEPVGALVEWCRSRVELGVTTVALPLELDRFGVPLTRLRRELAEAAGPRAETPPPSGSHDADGSGSEPSTS